MHCQVIWEKVNRNKTNSLQSSVATEILWICFQILWIWFHFCLPVFTSFWKRSLLFFLCWNNNCLTLNLLNKYLLQCVRVRGQAARKSNFLGLSRVGLHLLLYSTYWIQREPLIWYFWSITICHHLGLKTASVEKHKPSIPSSVEKKDTSIQQRSKQILKKSLGFGGKGDILASSTGCQL